MTGVWGLQVKAKSITRILKIELSKKQNKQCEGKIKRLMRARKRISRSIEEARKKSIRGKRR